LALNATQPLTVKQASVINIGSADILDLSILSERVPIEPNELFLATCGLHLRRGSFISLHP
jgi:hypothetical protein